MATTKPTRVEAERIAPEATSEELFLDRLAWFMDANFRIPGTKIRFGADQLAGLIPGVGDLAGGAVQAALILMAIYYYKLPKRIIVRMVLNSVLDTTVGAVPIVGDLFDVAFKVNMRNVRLLRDAAAKKRGATEST
ncbi:DUF4112 domain-containing protein [Tautonia rosea]|uniref:DUF4112 domain-containing protein n=1 Tax=Tautonia rosea TaxID=2728037 RepID=UPI001472E895|nr:DUF4112 domain-containing protein [Tautonia rosea]